jgi:hypothetical protein
MTTARALQTIVLTVLVLGGSSRALAQAPPRFGVVIGYPAAAGVMWRATDRFAGRAAVSWNHGSRDTERSSLSCFELSPCPLDIPAAADHISSTSWTLEVAAPIYLEPSTADPVRIYVAPAFALNRNTSTSPAVAFGSDDDTVSMRYQLSGSFGVEYRAAARLAMFAEAGVATSWLPASNDVILESLGRTRTRLTGTQAGVGVVVYFGH